MADEVSEATTGIETSVSGVRAFWFKGQVFVCLVHWYAHFGPRDVVSDISDNYTVYRRDGIRRRPRGLKSLVASSGWVWWCRVRVKSERERYTEELNY